ncbi:fatty acyl-AMP ligase [Streptomyces sp. AC558_RSS880]|uniref:fatty acyl-AMP ligase n=1 Tax=Streptomyces sp. AC558_RSS880 TaxID=2823687 RepID=UPI001C220A08|nr:fatty acyl-AMP ligase [Streptomyces sp. AC558_RSS880]
MDDESRADRAYTGAASYAEGHPPADGSAHPATETLLAAFTRLLDDDPGRALFTLVDEHGRDAETLTVRGLAREAERVRALLTGRAAPGDRALLVYLPSLDFVAAFLGCLAAGVLPVPLPPPRPGAGGPDPLAAVAAASGATVLLTHGPLLRAARAAGAPAPDGVDRPGPARLLTDDRGGPAPEPDPASWHRPADPAEPAFLQYTSGSTGAPKGVVITHRNVVHEVEAIARDLRLDADAVAVTWIPHFHNMGLVCFLLSTLAGYCPRTYVLSPLDVLRRPALWFDVVSRVRATHTAAPNFAYELMIARTTPEERVGWDLGHVRVLGSGGEMVQPATVERFFAAFLPYGLVPAAFCPGYGMAEHTLSVTMGGGGPLRVDRDALLDGRAEPVADTPGGDGRGNGGGTPGGATAVLYGSHRMTKPDSRLLVVDPQTRLPLPPGRVGEIWVDSPTKAAGYWGLERESEETFRAATADGDPHRYLRTGDLGFVHDGELYVTGRLKEMIVVRGQNHYPRDIEDAVRDRHPLIRPDGVAAFSVPADPDPDPDPDAASTSAAVRSGERLIVVVETSGPDAPGPEDERAVRAAVRAGVLENCGIAPDTVVVGPPGLVARTDTGKIRRTACREAFLESERARVARGAEAVR